MNHTINAVPGQIYRHFKGRLYQVVAVAEHTETGESLVIYQALYGTFKIYARPYDMFAGEVDRSKYSAEEYPQQYRFEPVEVVDSREDTVGDGSAGYVSNVIPVKSFVSAGEHTFGSESDSHAVKSSKTGRKNLQTGQELLMAFLETDSYREKLDILQAMRNECTETIVNSMALSLDMGLKGTSLEECMEEIRQSLMLHMKYEGRRK